VFVWYVSLTKSHLICRLHHDFDQCLLFGQPWIRLGLTNKCYLTEGGQQKSGSNVMLWIVLIFKCKFYCRTRLNIILWYWYVRNMWQHAMFDVYALLTVANLSSMEMLDVGPTFGASIAKVSCTEIPWVGSTSGATVANVSNMYLKWAPILYYCHKAPF